MPLPKWERVNVEVLHAVKRREAVLVKDKHTFLDLIYLLERWLFVAVHCHFW